MRGNLCYVTSLLVCLSSCRALGGEKAFFATPPMAPNTSHRQNVCHRYDAFRSKEVALQDALEGMQLHVVVGNWGDDYFNYDEERGIDPNYPGLQALILDELARRGRFTWRDSFGTYGDPASFNSTWTELLEWTLDTYDLTADYWAQTLERMSLGMAFVEGWLDASMVLIGKQPKPEDDKGIKLWNWLKPYDVWVWLMTIFTILLSGAVYQILEWYANERDERSLWEWWLENVYLSTINFTQAYEYQPKTLPSRLFGVSMAIWALVMTATYTANLASLLVDRGLPAVGPQTMEEVAVFKHRVCVWKGTSLDTYIRDTYHSAIRIEKQAYHDMYTGLQRGECDYLVDSFASWNKVKAMQAYNPYCNLVQVGDVIKEIASGLGTKADSGHLCTGFIRDVLNLHMRDMINSGFLKDVWDNEYKITQDIDCKAPIIPLPQSFRNSTSDHSNPDSENGERKLLKSNGQWHPRAGDTATHRRVDHGRNLKAAGKGATAGAVAAANGEDQRRLTIEQMIGTFAFHWGLMAIAIILASMNALYTKYAKPTSSHAVLAKAQRTSSEAPEGRLPSKALEATSALYDDDIKEDVRHLRQQMTAMQANANEEINSLRQHMVAMQLHLQRFEEKVLEDLSK